MMCQRITKEAKVAKEKCSPAQYHLRVSGENTGCQDQRESAGCEPFEALGLVRRLPKRVRIRVFQLRHRDRSPHLPGTGVGRRCWAGRVRSHASAICPRTSKNPSQNKLKVQSFRL